MKTAFCLPLGILLAIVIAPSLPGLETLNPWAELEKHVVEATWRSGITAAERIEQEALAVGEVRRAAEARIWQVRFQEKLEPSGAFARAWYAPRPDDLVAATWLDLISLEKLAGSATGSRQDVVGVGVDRPVVEWTAADFGRARVELQERLEQRTEALFALPAEALEPVLVVDSATLPEGPTAWDQVVRWVGVALRPQLEASEVVWILEGATADPEPTERSRAARWLADLHHRHLAAGRPEAAVAAQLFALDVASWQAQRASEVVDATTRLLDQGVRGEAPARVRWRRAWAEIQEHEGRSYSRALEEANRGIDAAAEGSRASGANISLARYLSGPELWAEMFSVDRPGRPSIRLSSRNLAEVELRAWRAGRCTYEDLRSAPESDPEVAETVPIDNTMAIDDPLGWRTTPIDPGLDYGEWIVELRAPGSAVRGCLEVTQLWAWTVERSGRLEVQVVRSRDGAPLEGAEVFRNGSGPPLGRTDADGLALLPAELELDRTDLLVVGLGTDQLRIRPDRSRWSAYESWENTRIATDRAVYRPGQVVQVKVFGLQRDDQVRSRPRDQGTVELVLVDPRREERGRRTVELSERGTATTSFEIPMDAALGFWGFSGHDTGFHVEDYKLPTFEVELEVDPGFWKSSGRTLALRGRVRSLVGSSLAGARVRWMASVQRLTDDSPYIDLDGETKVAADGSFAFQQDGLPQPIRGEGVAYSVEVEVLAGDGERREADLWFWRGAELSLTKAEEPIVVTRESDRARLSLLRRDAFDRPLPGPIEWQLSTLRAPGFGAVLPSEDRGRWRSEEAGGSEESRDWQNGIHYGWPVDQVIERGRLRATGDDARAELVLPPLGAGVYRVRFGDCGDWRCAAGVVVLPVGRDLDLPVPVAVAAPATVAAGRDAEVAVYCAGAGSAQVLVGRAEEDGERWRVDCGATTELRFPMRERDRWSPVGLNVVRVLDGQPLVFDGQLRVDPAERRLAVQLEPPMPSKPGEPVAVRAHVEAPDRRPADAEVLVVAYDRAFDVEFEPHRLPTADSGGYRGSAPAPEYVRRPMHRGHLGPGRLEPNRGPRLWKLPDAVATIVESIKTSWESAPDDEGGTLSEELVVVTAGAETISDSSTAAVTIGPSLGAAPLPPVRGLEARPPRQAPPATAVWIPDLVTDSKGRVAVDIDAPQAVGEWTLALHAFDRAARFGESRAVLATRLPLQVRIATPRILRAGDTLSLPVVVDNRAAGRNERVEVELEVQYRPTPGVATAALPVGEARSRRIARGEAAVEWFTFTVPEGEGEIALTARLAGRRHHDAETRVVPWMSRRVELSVGRSGFVRAGETREFAFDVPTGSFDRELQLAAWTEPLAPVIEQLYQLAAETWQCSDTLAERAAAMALLIDLAGRSAQLEAAVREGAGKEGALTFEALPAELEQILEQLSQRVTGGGLLSWWPGSPPSVWVSTSVLEHLAIVRRVAPERSEALAKRLIRGIDAAVRSPTFYWCDEFEPRLAAAFVPWELDEPAAKLLESVYGRLEGRWAAGSIREIAAVAWVFAQGGRNETAVAALRGLADTAVPDHENAWTWSPEPRAWQWMPEIASTQGAIVRAALELSRREVEVPAGMLEGVGRWLLRDVAVGPAGARETTLARATALIAWLGDRPNGAALEVSAWVGDRPVELVAEARGRSVVRVPQESLPEVDRLVADFAVESGEADATTLAAARLSWKSDESPATGDGSELRVERRLYLETKDGLWRPLAADEVVEVGAKVRIELLVHTAMPLAQVAIEDPRPAGFEPEQARSGYRWIDGRCVWLEIRDRGAHLFVERLEAGEFRLTHTVVARHPGTFLVPSARAEARLAPEISGYSAGGALRVGGAP